MIVDNSGSTDNDAGVNVSCELLPEPIKSDNDGKCYRSLRLANGMRVLLVSDVHQLPASSDSAGKPSPSAAVDPDSDEEVADDEDDDMDDDDENEDGEEEGEGEKMAAAALAVGCGSFCDPDCLPGLAHFVEHMIFMGSAKYPEENAFDSFVKSHGGSSNAYTDCEETVFHFDVNTASMPAALDRLAHLFIAPLMRADSMARERLAVNNEFQDALVSDSNRRDQLLSSVARAGHPMAKFMWGNMHSLSGGCGDAGAATATTDGGGAAGSGGATTAAASSAAEDTKAAKTGATTALDEAAIHGQLHAFWRRHYRAQHMTLVVQARRPLDTLQRWVAPVFALVSGDTVPRAQFTHCGLPWSPDRFHRLYRLAAVKDRHHVTLTWQLDSLVQRYRCRPLNYIAFLVGHEGVSSVLALLKRRRWATALTGGNSESGCEHNSACSLFSVAVQLTDDGLRNVHHVVAIVWAYLAMLRRLGAQQRIFDEIKRVEEMNFQFMETESAEEWVRRLASNMLEYSATEYITAEYVTPDFDRQLIDACVARMVPDQCNITLSSKSFETDPDCDRIEPWFGTRYSEQPVPVEWLAQDLGQYEACFSLPAPNTFIADSVALLPMPPAETVAAYPVCVARDTGGELYHRPDIRFRLPRAICSLLLRSNMVVESAAGAAMLDLWQRLLNYTVAELAYPATAAHLFYTLSANNCGLRVAVSGFNDKLPALLLLLMKQVVAFGSESAATTTTTTAAASTSSAATIDSDLFDVMLLEQRREYGNTMLGTKRLCHLVCLNVLQERRYPVWQRLAALDSVTAAGLARFVRQFRRQLFFQMLVQGNMSADQAEQLYTAVRQLVAAQQLPVEQLHEPRVLQLPVGDSRVRLASLNRDNTQSTIECHFQCGPGSIGTSCAVELLLFLMEEPAFDYLRTRHQLGYHVYSRCETLHGVFSFVLVVTFHIDQFSVGHVEHHIDTFLHDHFANYLDRLDCEEFESIRQALIKSKRCLDVSLDVEFDRNWLELVSRQYVFDRLSREIDALSTITLPHIRALFRCLVGLDSSTSSTSAEDSVRPRRKLCVQVVGFPSFAADPQGVALCSGQDRWQLPLLTSISDEQHQPVDTFIGSVAEFKTKCFIYPVCKTVA